MKRYVPPSYPPRRKVIYRGNISDRLGISFTWGVSEEYGAFFRYNWWHLYMPTVDCISSVLETASKKILKPSQEVMEEESSSIIKSSTKSEKTKARDWLRQKSSTLGVIWGGFGCIPEPPYYSCTALFSLSGFYVGGNIVRQLHNFCRNPFISGIDKTDGERISSSPRRYKPQVPALESNLLSRMTEDSTSATSPEIKRPSLDYEPVHGLDESLGGEGVHVDAKVRA